MVASIHELTKSATGSFTNSPTASVSYTERRALAPGGFSMPALESRSIFSAACMCALALALLSSVHAAAQGTPTAEAHKQWMNDASDAQEDFRFAVTDKNQKAQVEALAKLEALMAKTEDYWTARKASDGVRLAKEARALAAQAGGAAKGGNVSAAMSAFDKMGAACNTCHELHLEKK
jgi:hypothetical protein